MLKNRRHAGFLLVIFLLSVVLEMIPSEAEARRRGGGGRRFGGRARVSVRARIGGRANVQRRHVAANTFGRNNNNAISDFLDTINDPFGLNQFGQFSQLNQFGLQRLAIAPDFAVNVLGQVVALSSGNLNDPTRFIPFINNQLFATGGLSNTQLLQLQLLNNTGNFQTLGFGNGCSSRGCF